MVIMICWSEVFCLQVFDTATQAVGVAHMQSTTTPSSSSHLWKHDAMNSRTSALSFSFSRGSIDGIWMLLLLLTDSKRAAAPAAALPLHCSEGLCAPSLGFKTVFSADWRAHRSAAALMLVFRNPACALSAVRTGGQRQVDQPSTANSFQWSYRRGRGSACGVDGQKRLTGRASRLTHCVRASGLTG